MGSNKEPIVFVGEGGIHGGIINYLELLHNRPYNEKRDFLIEESRPDCGIRDRQIHVVSYLPYIQRSSQIRFWVQE